LKVSILNQTSLKKNVYIYKRKRGKKSEMNCDYFSAQGFLGNTFIFHSCQRSKCSRNIGVEKLSIISLDETRLS